MFNFVFHFNKILPFEVLIVTKAVGFFHDAQMAKYVLVLLQQNVLRLLTPFFFGSTSVWAHLE